MDLNGFFCLSGGLIFSYCWIKLSEAFYNWVHSRQPSVYHPYGDEDASFIDAAMWLSMEGD